MQTFTQQAKQVVQYGGVCQTTVFLIDSPNYFEIFFSVFIGTIILPWSYWDQPFLKIGPWPHVTFTPPQPAPLHLQPPQLGLRPCPVFIFSRLPLSRNETLTITPYQWRGVVSNFNFVANEAHKMRTTALTHCYIALINSDIILAILVSYILLFACKLLCRPRSIIVYPLNAIGLQNRHYKFATIIRSKI